MKMENTLCLHPECTDLLLKLVNFKDHKINYSALNKILFAGKFTKGFTTKYRLLLPYYSF